ncbi:MAG: hypothetical protein QM704_18735 [Anaeromyxobacteraceae bacterium]
MRTPTFAPAAFALATLLACTDGTPAAPLVAVPAPAPAPPPKPPPTLRALVVEGVAAEPGGRTVPLLAEPQPVVHAASTFRVVLEGRLADARLSLLDGGDALVASEGARELGARTTLLLTPAAPLASGTAYQLRLDGASSREVHDAEGHALEPLSLPFLVAGEKAAPAKGEKKKAKRRR